MILVAGRIAGLSWKLTHTPQMDLVVSCVPSFLPVLIIMAIQWNAYVIRETINEASVRPKVRIRPF